MDSSLIAVLFQSSTAHILHGRQVQTMNTVSLGAVVASARQSLLPLSIVTFILRREMRVEVAVHSVLRNHSVAESTFIRAAALRRRHLCPHVNCLTQLRAPERLQSRMNQRKQYIIYALNNPYTRSIKACRTTWLSSWSISCFKEYKNIHQPNCLHKYWAILKAMPKCLIISLFVCSSKLPNKVSPIINARVDVLQGENHHVEKLDQCLDLTACHSQFFFFLLGIYTHQHIKSHLTVILVPSDSDSVMCFHLAHAFQQKMPNITRASMLK